MDNKDSIKEERIYLGSYEIYRKYDNGNIKLVERETVHISDDIPIRYYQEHCRQGATIFF